MNTAILKITMGVCLVSHLRLPLMNFVLLFTQEQGEADEDGVLEGSGKQLVNRGFDMHVQTEPEQSVP